MKLTKEQLRNLLNAAYGFVDEYGSLLLFNFYEFENSDKETAILTSMDGEWLVYRIDDSASLTEEGELTMTNTDGKPEEFTVLTVACGETLKGLLNH